MSYIESFKKLLTRVKLDYSLRRKSRRLIAGIVSSSSQPAWRTPATSDVGVDPEMLADKDGNPPKLGARMYRTGKDGKPVRSKSGEIISQSQTLELQVRLLNSSSASSRRSPWRTPHASDGEGGVMEMRPEADAHLKLRDHVANWSTPQAHDVHGAKTPVQVADQRKRTKAGVRNLNEDVRNWPTPNAFPDAPNKNSNQRNGEPSLGPRARNWPTPRSEDSESAGNHTDARTHPGDSLTGVLKSWPTPASRDGKGTNSEMHVTTKGTGRKHMDQLPNFIEHGQRTGEIRSASFLPTRTTRSRGHKCSIKCRRLNPRFASWLMSWSPGWISFESSETALWLFRARMRLASLLAGYAHVFNPSSTPWSTPRAGEGRDGDQSKNAKGKGFAPMLCKQSRKWPSPQARDYRSVTGNEDRQRDHAEQNLNVKASRWPTPHSLAGDGHGSELSMTATVTGGYSNSERTKKRLHWPTPSSQGSAGEISEDLERRGGKLVNKKTGRILQTNLATEVKRWPTPRANTLEGRGTAKRKPGTGGKILNEEAEKWLSPNSKARKSNGRNTWSTPRAHCNIVGKKSQKPFREGGNTSKPGLEDQALASGRGGTKRIRKSTRATISGR